MGCDIHGVIERRVGDKWIAVRVIDGVSRPGWHSEPYIWVGDVARSRNYRRFAALAGVRGSGPDPRGVPEDASETTRWLVEKMGSDGHSHSWLPIAEAAEIFARTEPWPEGIKETGWPREYPSSLFFNVESEDADQHRLVFWFDN